MSSFPQPCETPTLEIAELLRQVDLVHNSNAAQDSSSAAIVTHGPAAHGGLTVAVGEEAARRQGTSTPTQQTCSISDFSSWVRSQTPQSVSRGTTPTAAHMQAYHNTIASPFSTTNGLSGGHTGSTLAGGPSPYSVGAGNANVGIANFAAAFASQPSPNRPSLYATGGGGASVPQPRGLFAALSEAGDGESGLGAFGAGPLLNHPGSLASPALADCHLGGATNSGSGSGGAAPMHPFIPVQLFSDVDGGAAASSNGSGGATTPSSTGGFTVSSGRRMPIAASGSQIPTPLSSASLFAPLDYAPSGSRNGAMAPPLSMTPVQFSAMRSVQTTPFTYTPPPAPNSEYAHMSPIHALGSGASPSATGTAAIGYTGGGGGGSGPSMLSVGSLGFLDFDHMSPGATRFASPLHGAAGPHHHHQSLLHHHHQQHVHPHHLLAAAAGGMAPPPPPPPPLAVPTSPAEIVAATRDQAGCRLLQQVVESYAFASQEVSRIVAAVEPMMADLMADQYGNFLFQKIHDAADDATRLRIMGIVIPSMARIAATQHGTFAVQKLVESVRNADEEALVTSGIRAQLQQLMTDTHGGHVIQRLLTSLGTCAKRQFIYDGLCDAMHPVCCDKFGCCVVQKCIDAADDEQLRQVAHKILETIVEMASDAFGNYVVQKLQHALSGDNSVNAALQLHSPSGPVLPHARHQDLLDAIGRMLLPSIATLATNRFASKAVEACVKHCGDDVAVAMMRALSADGNTIRRVATDQFGNYIVQTMLVMGPLAGLRPMLDALVPSMAFVVKTATIGRRIETKIDAARYRLEHDGALPPGFQQGGGGAHHHSHSHSHHHHAGGGVSPSHGLSSATSPHATPQRAVIGGNGRRGSGQSTPVPLRPVAMQPLTGGFSAAELQPPLGPELMLAFSTAPTAQMQPTGNSPSASPAPNAGSGRNPLAKPFTRKL